VIDVKINLDQSFVEGFPSDFVRKFVHASNLYPV
jgi:hypothetical protein